MPVRRIININIVSCLEMFLEEKMQQCYCKRNFQSFLFVADRKQA